MSSHKKKKTKSCLYVKHCFVKFYLPCSVFISLRLLLMQPYCLMNCFPGICFTSSLMSVDQHQVKMTNFEQNISDIAPVWDNDIFMARLLSSLPDRGNHYPVIGGDFNLIPDVALDRSSVKFGDYIENPHQPAQFESPLENF